MKNLFYLLIILVVSLPISCSQDKKSSGPTKAAAAKTVSAQPNKIFRSITPTEARELRAKRKDLLLIDVRNQQELREGFIEGSHLVPFWNIAKGQVNLPSDRPLLLICAVGGRSYGIGQMLSKKGYPEIYNLKGGISAWKRAGLPLQYK